MIKKIKYENETTSIKKNNHPGDFYVYLATKTKKSSWLKARKLLKPFDMLFGAVHKDWCSIWLGKDRIPWELYTKSSTIYVGQRMSLTPVPYSEHLKIMALPTQPLILITCYRPGYIHDVHRNKIIYGTGIEKDLNSPSLLTLLLDIDWPRPEGWDPHVKIPHFELYDFFYKKS